MTQSEKVEKAKQLASAMVDVSSGFFNKTDQDAPDQDELEIIQMAIIALAKVMGGL